MRDDRELIADFAATRSPAAFEELVRRHVDWIYATARRQVGDSNAPDVTQAVFVVLAQKAAPAARQPALAPWLFGVLRFTCLRCRRDETRRQRHERAATEQRAMTTGGGDAAEHEQLLATLDQLVGKLRERDRRPVVMRFYQRSSFAEIGRALGVSEEAARKRVTRGVDRLRSMFAARGVSAAPGDAAQLFTLTILAHAAPPAVATHAIGAAMTGTTSILAKGAMAMMRIQQLQRAAMVLLAVTTVAAAGGVATHVLGNGGPVIASSGTRTVTLPATPQVNTIQSQQTIIAVSRDGMRITGYSKQLGKWTPLALDADAQARLKAGAKLSPIVAERVAALRLGTRVYAYSPVTATWDQVDVADKADADPALDADSAQVNYDDRLHIFSAVTGKWATVNFGG
jgi:RNA polymerase sigma factor (sigma-70 family)